MAITTCPHCTSKLSVGSDLIGREVECGSCGRAFVAAPEDTRGSPAPDLWAGMSPDDDRGSRRRDPDDDDDRPRRRRRRRTDDEDDREWAEDQVQQPATMLQVVGWWGVFIGSLNLLFAVAVPIIAVNLPPPPANAPGGPGGGMNPQQDMIISAGFYVVQGVYILGLSFVILTGAARMKRLESRGLAMTAAILAMIPCFSPCCLLGLPFGVIAIQTMNKPVVREQFERNDRS
jgi:predicted Zn finger-like uncharacterized protein